MRKVRGTKYGVDRSACGAVGLTSRQRVERRGRRLLRDQIRVSPEEMPRATETGRSASSPETNMDGC